MHAFGVNFTIEMVNNGTIGTAYAETAVVIWVFGSITMFLTGCTLIYLSGRLKILAKGAWRLAVLIGLGIAGFGGGFYISHPDSPHMLGFLIVGLLILIPLFIYFRAYK